MKQSIEERIYARLKDMVAIDSVSYSAAENAMSDYALRFFSGIPYLKERPDQFGLHVIEGDAFGRTVPYALLLGNSPNTVVSMGHIDVVGTESYGELSRQAYELGDELEQALAAMDLPEEARKDMDSNEWIWGRGAADMKGGLSIHMALFEEYAALAEQGELPGNLLMILVPDEESYSAGMRSAAGLILKLKEQYGLDLKLVVDPEPTNERGGAQVMSIGSVGKIMPVVMVQGVTAHVGHCFDGITPLGILAEIYQKTNLSLEFSDRYKDEATVPPTWTYLRDMKELYDVSIPYRAAGYFTALTFDSTPEQVMVRLKRIAENALENSVRELDGVYQEYKKRDKFAKKEGISYKTAVYSFEELAAELKERDPAKFDAYYGDVYRKIGKRVESGELNFPAATLKLMEAVLQYAEIKHPVVLIGFAPPYYLPIHADLIPGKENMGSEAYAVVKQAAESEFSQTMDYENYFMGISDASYCGIDHPFDYTKFSANTPMWGDLYQLDFDAMEAIGIPAVIYGPIGKEYHMWTERVNKRSLFEVVPSVTRTLFDYIWSL